MTPKQRVLKRFPAAFAYEWAGPSWCVYRPHFSGNLDLGIGKTATQAWADAAKHPTVRRSSTRTKA